MKSRTKKKNFTFADAAHLVVITQSASVNNLRIRLGLTYKRAREVMEQLIQAGIVGPSVTIQYGLNIQIMDETKTAGFRAGNYEV